MDIFERAKNRLSAQNDQEKKAKLESVIKRLKTEPLTPDMVLDLADCECQKPATEGYLWWKKYKCPSCQSPIKLTTICISSVLHANNYYMSSCSCGWL